MSLDTRVFAIVGSSRLAQLDRAPATNQRSQVRVLQGAPFFSTTYGFHASRRVNNCEQFTSDFVRRGPQGAVEDLRVDIQRRVDVGVSHELSDDLAGHALVMRPG